MPEMNGLNAGVRLKQLLPATKLVYLTMFQDPELAQEEEAELPVQVNGKLRGRIRVPLGASKELIEQRAVADEKIIPFLDGKQIGKIIIVPGKMVNIVVRTS